MSVSNRRNTRRVNQGNLNTVRSSNNLNQQEDRKLRGKKASFVLFYIIINIAPYVDLDYFRLPVANQVFKYVVGFPAGYLGDLIHKF